MMLFLSMNKEAGLLSVLLFFVLFLVCVIPLKIIDPHMSPSGGI